VPTEEKDFYSILGVSRDASPEELRRAYRDAALHLHPDKNVAPGDTELFLEATQAYEILSDPDRRKSYDEELAEDESEKAATASFQCSILNSRKNLIRLDEPQVHYILLNIKPAEFLPDTRPSINMAIIVDHSTSMRGQRLDQIRTAALSILKNLEENDTVSIISFSDRAEVIISPEQAKDFKSARARLSLLQAGGGTEIGQGLEAGLTALHNSFSRDGVNQVVLLTDGRTYGDEDLCISLADQASMDGITINCIGIGSEWSDRLLDDLASRSGGSVIFLNSPRAIHDLLQGIYTSLSHMIASRVRIDGNLGQQVDLRSAFRIKPEPMPLGDRLPLTLGNLSHESEISLILEVVVHPVGEIETLRLANFNINGDILHSNIANANLPVEIQIPVSEEPDTNPPPEAIVSALNLIALYRMQEMARHESELGQSSQAARRLENLAMHLISSGERDLAKTALNEAARLSRTQRISSMGEKVLKYGTRALMLPAPRKSNHD
jgi:Ca-activated chloride channel family protein